MGVCRKCATPLFIAVRKILKKIKKTFIARLTLNFFSTILFQELEV
jgi:hypothetical protein